MLGAAWGVMILVGEFTVIVGLERENTRYIEEEGGMTYIALETTSGKGLTLEDVSSIASNSTPSFIISPEITLKAREGFHVLGVAPSFHQIASFSLERGRFISDVDLRRRSRVCVLGPAAEESLFQGLSGLGQEIELEGNRYVVVGIMEHKDEKRDMISGRHMGRWKSMRKNAMVLIPFTTAGMRHRATASPVRMDFRTETLAQVADAIDEILMTLQDLGHSPKEFDVRSRSEELEWIYSMVRRWKFGLYAMIVLCLLMAAIGVANLMLVQVNERIREIGLRKAMGASNLDVFAHFLVESTVLSLLGGGMGIVLGIGLAKVVSSLVGLPYGFSPSVTSLGFVVSVVVGIGAGLAPAWKAAKLSPVEALRYE